MKVGFGRKDSDMEQQLVLTFCADQESFIGASSCIPNSSQRYCNKKCISPLNRCIPGTVAAESEINSSFSA